MRQTACVTSFYVWYIYTISQKSLALSVKVDVLDRIVETSQDLQNDETVSKTPLSDNGSFFLNRRRDDQLLAPLNTTQRLSPSRRRRSRRRRRNASRRSNKKDGISKNNLYQEKEQKDVAANDAKKRLQKDISKVAADIEKLKSYTPILAHEVEKLESTFMKDVDSGTIAEDELPKGKQTGSTGYGHMYCPMDCDPSICDNKSAKNTQCFKVSKKIENSIEVKTRLCEPFVVAESLRCPDDFVRCSMAAPKRGTEFHLKTLVPNMPKHPITLEGYNLHQCLHLILIPQDMKCDSSKMKELIEASIPIMGFGSSNSFPHLTNDTQPKAVFQNIEVLKPGTFDVCLIQFHRPGPGQEQRILGAGKIGTAIAEKSPESQGTLPPDMVPTLKTIPVMKAPDDAGSSIQTSEKLEAANPLFFGGGGAAAQPD